MIKKMTAHLHYVTVIITFFHFSLGTFSDSMIELRIIYRVVYIRLMITLTCLRQVFRPILDDII